MDICTLAKITLPSMNTRTVVSEYLHQLNWTLIDVVADYIIKLCTEVIKMV